MLLRFHCISFFRANLSVQVFNDVLSTDCNGRAEGHQGFTIFFFVIHFIIVFYLLQKNEERIS